MHKHLDHIASQAQAMRKRLRLQLAENNPFNPVEWKNSREAWEGWIDRTADEIVMHELVFVPDEETERAMRDGYTD